MRHEKMEYERWWQNAITPTGKNYHFLSIAPQVHNMQICWKLRICKTQTHLTLLSAHFAHLNPTHAPRCRHLYVEDPALHSKYSTVSQRHWVWYDAKSREGQDLLSQGLDSLFLAARDIINKSTAQLVHKCWQLFAPLIGTSMAWSCQSSHLGSMGGTSMPSNRC